MAFLPQNLFVLVYFQNTRTIYPTCSVIENSVKNNAIISRNKYHKRKKEIKKQCLPRLCCVKYKIINLPFCSSK